MPRRRLAIALAVAAALVVWGAALLTAIRLGSSLLSAPAPDEAEGFLEAVAFHAAEGA